MSLGELLKVRDACKDLLQYPGWLGPTDIIEKLLDKTNGAIDEQISCQNIDYGERG